MYRNDVLKRVVAQFHQIAEKEVYVNVPISNLELDSIDYMKIMIGIENEFGFEFRNEDLDLEKYGDIDHFIDFIMEHYFSGELDSTSGNT